MPCDTPQRLEYALKILAHIADLATEANMPAIVHLASTATYVLTMPEAWLTMNKANIHQDARVRREL